MNCCILMGSPHPTGNTHSLTVPFLQEMERNGVSCRCLFLYSMDLRPCLGCRTCQKDWTGFGCPQKDDMESVFHQVLQCDLMVVATPIYSWYCTPPVKAVLDRLVYGMNKFYGEKKGPSLWAGKKAALIATCGYPPEKGADLMEEGLRRYCKHSGLLYAGALIERHMGYDRPFMDGEKADRAVEFAKKLRQML